jgi:hypothetical protein
MHEPEPFALACSLELPALATRVADIGRLCLRHLRTHSLEGRTLRLAFAPAAAAEIERLIDLERACCAFLHFEIVQRGEEIELAIVAPARAGLDTSALLAPFLQAAGAPDDEIANNDGSAGANAPAAPPQDADADPTSAHAVHR